MAFLPKNGIKYLFIVTVFNTLLFFSFTAEQVVEESKTCGKILTVLAWILVILTMPFSLLVCFKVSVLFYLVLKNRTGILIFCIGKQINVAQNCFLNVM